jgi:hypothetical protein
MEVNILFFIKNHIHNVVEFISLLIALFYYPYIKNSFMKWFLPFLAFVFIAEFTISYQYILYPTKPNANINYIIGFFESIFYNYIFYHLCYRASLKKAIVVLGLISTTTYFFGFIFYQDDISHFGQCLIITGFCLSGVALGYIYSKFSDDNKTIIIGEPGFWIAFGVSIFFSGVSIVFCLHDFIMENDLKLFGVRLYSIVPKIFCIILYLSISTAIILCKKKNKISL